MQQRTELTVLQTVPHHGTLNVANANCANVKFVLQMRITTKPSGIKPAVSANAFPGESATMELYGISKLAIAVSEPTKLILLNSKLSQLSS